MSSHIPPHRLPHIVWNKPRTRSGVATYLNLLIACTALASAAVSGALVMLGGKNPEPAKPTPAKPKDSDAVEP